MAAAPGFDSPAPTQYLPINRKANTVIINIDTSQPLSDADKAVLAVLSGGVPVVKAEATQAPSTPAPAAKAPAKPTPAPKAEKTPEPDPEPEAQPDTELDRDAAVALATKLVSSGKAKEVKAALTDLGAKRVSELSDEDIPTFIAALS